MATLADCEKQVIEVLISVFSKAVNNCSLAENNESEVIVVEKVLQVLLAQNESLYSNGIESVMSILEDQEVIPSKENMTNLIPVLDDGGKSVNPNDVGINRLRQLEIIKVFVLIFVISIILFTTCRMVFQLFIRFRPEKPPLS